ncbi:hypothetical protein [Methylomicrobium lacus]|uniref:hypothetical protein n=1 Tax=Methylomicrobium lacus TaxID=136992 RepID=UPI0035A8CD14
MCRKYYISALGAVAFVFIFSLPACSVYKAATQPGPADLTGIGIGSPRSELIAKLGAPKLVDDDKTGKKQDVFEFQSGLPQASKIRIIPYLAADVFTAGLAELLLWPLELTFLESATCVGMATYDPSKKVLTWSLSKKDGTQDC